MNGKWSIGKEEPVYESDWLNVSVAEATLPDETKIDHHLVRCGKGGAGVVVHDVDQGVLLIWRHRIVGNAWGWEIPGGRIDAQDKDPAAAAMREVREETGWEVSDLKKLVSCQPVNGFLDHPFHFFYTQAATWVGPAPDANEVADIAWVPVSKLPELINKGEITDGFSLIPLLYCMSMGPLT